MLTRVNPAALGAPKPDQTGRNQPTASVRHPAPNARGQALRNPRSPLRTQITGLHRTQCCKSTTYAKSQSDPAFFSHSALRVPHSALKHPQYVKEQRAPHSVQRCAVGVQKIAPHAPIAFQGSLSLPRMLSGLLLAAQRKAPSHTHRSRRYRIRVIHASPVLPDPPSRPPPIPGRSRRSI